MSPDTVLGAPCPIWLSTFAASVISLLAKHDINLKEASMADIIVRRLESAIKERLKLRATANGRSLEAEARAILEEAVSQDTRQIGKGKRRLGTRLKLLIGSGALTREDWAEFDKSIAELRSEWPMREIDFGK
jgi:plasmid stability protein